VTQPDDIDESALRRVNANSELVIDGKLRSAKIECLAIEGMNIDRDRLRRRSCRHSAALAA